VKILLHICCAPCSVYTVKTLRDEGAEVSGYFYNPNIHPYTEFAKRLETLKNYAAILCLPVEIDGSYDLETFLRGALERGKDRCLFCYTMRLERAFRKAVLGQADAVTTTLLYSKYQRHDDIKAIGEELSGKYGVAFLYRDFRAGWKQGIEESKRLGLYRQQYCGCIFSEKERFGGLS
jgi:predicted adenine nucleotide alpha hydrolase (AANH) superfamily ATPase